MAKGKRVTAEEIEAIVETLEDLGQTMADIEKRISNGHFGPDALDYGRSLTCASRNCANMALRMLGKHDLNSIREQTKKLIEKHANIAAEGM